jgi:predicted permease
MVQIALATVLLVASGLMIRSFAALNRVDSGVAGVDDVQLFRLRLPEALVPDADRVFQTHRDLRDRLTAIPGVTAVAFASAGPLQRANAGDPLEADHQTFAEGQIPPVRLFKFISPEYFATIGARMVAGRPFASSDIEANRPVAIVTETLAREMWGSVARAVGGRVREMPNSTWREVVGVVADIRDQGLHVPAPPTVYWPAYMRDFGGEPIRAGRGMTFVLRTDRAGTEALMSDVRQAVRATSPNLALTDVRTLDELYRGFLVQTSVTLSLLGVSAAMAALLSLIGIYGVLSYTASQRARELGIRTALGAGRGSLRAMFVRDGLRLSVVGVGAGLVAAIGLTQFMTSLLVGVTAVDPLTYLAVGGALAAAAAVASYVPARRATSGNPIDVLRAS